MSLLIKGITKLSQLAIDTAKNWGGLKIENLGAPDSGDDAKRHDSAPAAHNQAASTITSEQFPLVRMPRGTDTHVLTGKGAGVSPAYEAPAGGNGGIWTLLETLSPSSAATINSSVLTAYDMFMVIFSLALDYVNEQNLRLRLNLDSGNNYGYRYIDSTTVKATSLRNNILLTSGLTANPNTLGILYLPGKLGETRVPIMGSSGAGTYAYDRFLSGEYDASADITRFTFYMEVGDITGKIAFYGMNFS